MKIVIEQRGNGWVWDVHTTQGLAHGETTDLFSAVESLRECLKYIEHLPWDPATEHLSSVELLHATLREQFSMSDKYPGFTITCDKCGSKIVEVVDDQEYNPECGPWGTVDLVCRGCNHRMEIVDSW